MEAQPLDCISVLVSGLELCYFQHRQGYVFYKLSFFHCSDYSNIKSLVLEMAVEYMPQEKHFIFEKRQVSNLSAVYILKIALYLAEGELANAQRYHNCISALPPFLTIHVLFYGHHLCLSSVTGQTGITRLDGITAMCVAYYHLIQSDVQMKATSCSKCELVLVIFRWTSWKTIMLQLSNKQTNQKKTCLSSMYQEIRSLGLKSINFLAPAAEKQQLRNRCLKMKKEPKPPVS